MKNKIDFIFFFAFVFAFLLVSLSVNVSAVPTYFKWFNGSGYEIGKNNPPLSPEINTYSFNLSGAFFRNGTGLWNTGGSFGFGSGKITETNTGSGLNNKINITAKFLAGSLMCIKNHTGSYSSNVCPSVDFSGTFSASIWNDVNVPCSLYPSSAGVYPVAVVTTESIPWNYDPHWYNEGCYDTGASIMNISYPISGISKHDLTVNCYTLYNSGGFADPIKTLNSSYSCTFVEGPYISCTPGSFPPDNGLYCCPDNNGGNYWTPIACGPPPVCGNGDIEPGEECEIGGTCGAGQSCLVGDICPLQGSQCQNLIETFTSYSVDNNEIVDTTYKDGNVAVVSGRLKMTIDGTDTPQSGAPEYNWWNQYRIDRDIVQDNGTRIEVDYNITNMISGVEQSYGLKFQRWPSDSANLPPGGCGIQARLKKQYNDQWILDLNECYGAKASFLITNPLSEFKTGKLRVDINNGKIGMAIKGSGMSSWLYHDKNLSFPLTKRSNHYHTHLYMRVDKEGGSNFPGTSEVFWDNFNITGPCSSGGTCTPVANDGICGSDCKINQTLSCGNNEVEAGEVCDDGMQCSGNTSHYCSSNSDCAALGFGSCGPQNGIGGIGCNKFCNATSGPSCGNGIVNSGEACDAGPTGNNLCNPSCRRTYCGDGIKQSKNSNGTTEMCDDGNSINTDLCSNNCTLNEAGDDGDPYFSIAIWKDINNNTINTANVGDVVRLYVLSNGLNSSFQIKFNISEDDFLGPVFLGSSYVGGFQNPIGVNGTTSAPWTIPDLNFSNSLGDPPWELYFNASLVGNHKVSILSPELIVSPINSEANSSVGALITGPKHRGIYYNGTNINFTQQATSSALNYSWIIKHNSGSQQDIVKTENNFVLNFTTSGEKTITLKVTNNSVSPPIVNEDQIAILVISSPGTFAFINQPKHLEVVNRIVNKSLEIIYNASDSFVVYSNVSEVGCVTGVVTCLAGICPSQTENSPNACGGGPRTILNPVKPFTASSTFTWNFVSLNQQKIVSGQAGVSDKKRYGHYLDGERNSILGLNLVYNNGSVATSSLTERKFTTGQCLNGGTLFLERDNKTGTALSEPILTSSNSTACSGPDGLIGGGDDCCPAGSYCSVNGCVLTNQTGCSQYLDSQECSKDKNNAWKLDPLNSPDLPPVGECFSESSGLYIRCECYWQPVTQNQPNCGFRKVVENLSSSDTYSCEYVYTQGQCVQGLMDVLISVNFSTSNPSITANGVGCTSDNSPKSILCGRRSIDLPFFDYRNVLAALAIIALIYIIIWDLKRNERKKNKKK